MATPALDVDVDCGAALLSSMFPASLPEDVGDELNAVDPKLTISQAKAEQTKNQAEAERDVSGAAAKAGPFTVSSSGAATKDNPDRTQGSWDQTIGSGKETVGNLIGNESLKHEGRDQNLKGQGQEAQGQLSDFGTGVSSRVQGAVGGAAASLTGDRARQEEYADMHDEGKTRQRGAELDMNKTAGA